MKVPIMTMFAVVLGLTAASAEHGLIRDNDKDGDKKLSWAEVEPIGWSKYMFELKDMDGDGFLWQPDPEEVALIASAKTGVKVSVTYVLEEYLRINELKVLE